MTVLSRLEHHLGFLAIDHLPIYIVSAQAILYLWCWLNPSQAHLLLLDPMAVRYAGEYWRLLTFLFLTPLQNPLFAAFFLYLLYYYGSALENAWGSFKFTIFYLVGAVFTLVAGFLFGGFDGAFYLNTSILLAFAALFPDFLLWFIIPFRIKWLALATWLYLLFQLWAVPFYGKMAILACLANYFIFFGKTHFDQLVELIQHVRHRQRFRNWNQ